MHSGKAHLLAAALLFSTGGLVIKSIALTGWQVACLRAVIAGVVVAMLLPESRRNWQLRLIGPAISYAAMLILFVISTKLTTAANAIFLQATAPLYLVFLGPSLLKERTRREDWLTLLVMGAGMTLFFLGEPSAQATAPRPVLGNFLAAAGGLAWALVLLSLRVWGRKHPTQNHGMQVVLAGNLLAAVLCAPFIFPLESATPMDLGLVGYLGVFQVALAYLMMTKGMRQVPALEASMILLVEPVLNPVWTWLVLGENPGWLAILGGALILSGTALRFRTKAPDSVEEEITELEDLPEKQ
jgi:DME family drug/metabolite transporter